MPQRRRDPLILQRIRKVVQLVFFFLLIFLLVRFIWGSTPKSGGPLLVTAILMAVLSLILGRVWCGWACPVNSILERVHFRGALQRSARIDNRWRYFKYGVLVVTVAIILWSVLQPITAKEATRASIVGWITGALIGIVGLEAITDHFFCRYLCPLGGAVALLAKIAPMRRIVRSHCNDCSVCVDACPVGIIDHRQSFTNDRGECTVCLDCLVVCTSSSNGFSFRSITEERVGSFGGKTSFKAVQ